MYLLSPLFYVCEVNEKHSLGPGFTLSSVVIPRSHAADMFAADTQHAKQNSELNSAVRGTKSTEILDGLHLSSQKIKAVFLALVEP